VFDITFQSATGTTEHAWQTSWGVSTRLVGALIMGHGDDAGLRVPPALAPIQAVVVLVRDEEGAGERAAALAAELRGAGVRVELDDRVDTGFGRRAVEWELKGVPVRIEVGPRDLAAGTVALVRRDVVGEKATVPLDGLGARVADVLDEIQSSLYQQALDRREAGTVEAADLEETRSGAQGGFARVAWDRIRDAEVDLAADALTVRCLQRADGTIPGSSAESGLVATVGKAY
jgi:prolyl-tRNA synthetase